MTRRAVLNSIVAVVAILVSGTLAVAAVLSGPPSEAAELVAAGIDGQASVTAEPTRGISLTSLPAPPTTTARRPATTVPRAPTSVAPPYVSDPDEPPPLDVGPDPAETAPATAPANPPTPRIAPPPGPSSWSAVSEGVTVTARIEPAAPRVGDTVTIHYAVEGAGDLCCGSSVEVGNALVAMNPLPLGPHACPMERVTAWSTTVVVSQPGPFTFLVHGNHVEQFCTAPPSSPVNVTLYATFQVLPAA